jgi:hypothetical protein
MFSYIYNKSFFYKQKIIVNIHFIQIPYENNNNIENFLKELGNIPYYLSLEGGYFNGCTYLFCIDANIDFRKIVEKYKYKYYDTIDKIKIDKELYNNKYQIRINYGKQFTESYRLQLR